VRDDIYSQRRPTKKELLQPSVNGFVPDLQLTFRKWFLMPLLNRPAAPNTHEPVNTNVLLVIAVAMAVIQLLGLYLWRRLGRVAPPTVASCASTLWCGRGGRHDAARQTALLVFRAAAVAWYSYRLIHFAEAGTLNGRPMPLRIKNSFFTVWNYELQGVLWAVAVCTSAIHRCATLPPATSQQPLSCGGSSRQPEPLAIAPGGVNPGGLLPDAAGPRRSRADRAGCAVAALHSLIFSVCLPSAVLVTIVLWTVLYPSDAAAGHSENELNFGSYNMHAINTALLLLDFGVSRLVVRPQQLYLTLAWACSYCVFAWVQHASTYFWPYFFLDLSGWGALAWCAAHLSIYLSIYQTIYLSINQSIYPSIYPSINLSIYPSIHLFIHPSINQSIYESINLTINLSIYPSIHLSIHISIYPSINQSISQSINLSIYLSISLSLSLSIRILEVPKAPSQVQVHPPLTPLCVLKQLSCQSARPAAFYS